MGSFLKKVEAAETILLEDVYTGDAQFRQLIDLVVSLLGKFADKFQMSEQEALELFVKQLKKEI